MPVVNPIGGDIQLPPVLDSARYDTSGSGPAANHGLLVSSGFGDSVVLEG